MFVMILICVLELLCFRVSLNVYECVTEFFECACVGACMGASVCVHVWVCVCVFMYGCV